MGLFSLWSFICFLSSRCAHNHVIECSLSNGSKIFTRTNIVIIASHFDKRTNSDNPQPSWDYSTDSKASSYQSTGHLCHLQAESQHGTLSNASTDGYLPKFSESRRDLLKKAIAMKAVLTVGISSNLDQAIAATDSDLSIRAQIQSTDSGGRYGQSGILNNEILASFQYERLLGKGSYKQVYSVFTDQSDTFVNDANHLYAMSVEQLRSKTEARDEMRGIRIVEDIHRLLGQSPDRKYFESILDWWIQFAPVSPYKQDDFVFPRINAKTFERSRKRPTLFIGNKLYYLVAIKPLYDMDLKRFSRICNEFYPIFSESSSPSRLSENETIVAGINLNDEGALKLVYEMCHVGRILHDDLKIVHRDIKPKNMMLSKGHIVLIDFGFADFGEKGRDGNANKLCITEAATIKGELNYVNAEDVAFYQGCKEGDTYAMGRTIFEVCFGKLPLQEADSRKATITAESSMEANKSFRALITADGVADASRFKLSASSRDIILDVVRGLCRLDNPFSFSDAETYIEERAIVG